MVAWCTQVQTGAAVQSLVQLLAVPSSVGEHRCREEDPSGLGAGQALLQVVAVRTLVHHEEGPAVLQVDQARVLGEPSWVAARRCLGEGGLGALLVVQGQGQEVPSWVGERQWQGGVGPAALQGGALACLVGQKQAGPQEVRRGSLGEGKGQGAPWQGLGVQGQEA